MTTLSPHTIYTFGYSGFEPEELRTFAHAKNAIVIDTRYSAYSRQPGWAMKQLSDLFGWNGYRYFGKSFGNLNYKTEGAGIMLANPEIGIREVEPFLRHRSIILLCGCWNFATCHRTVVAQLIHERFGNPVQHITRAEIPRVNTRKKKQKNQIELF